MKLQISRLSSVRCDGNTASFSGDSGEILLSLFEPGIVRVSYEFFALPVSEERATLAEELGPGTLMSEGFFGPGAKAGRWTSVKEEEGSFVLTAEDLAVAVEKADGFVSVFADGRLVHGGRVGTKDTVLPRFSPSGGFGLVGPGSRRRRRRAGEVPFSPGDEGPVFRSGRQGRTPRPPGT